MSAEHGLEPVERSMEPAAERAARPLRRVPALAQAVTLEGERGPDLRAAWLVLRKRRWTVFMIFLLVTGTVLLATLQQTPVYRAQALVEIQKENPDILTVEELFQIDSVSDAYLETQYKVLQSETLAQQVIERLGLREKREFQPPEPWWPMRLVRAAPAADAVPPHVVRRRTLEKFRERLEVAPIKRSRLVEVRFESRDPALAAAIVNALCESYIQQNLQARWEATQKAGEWMGQQLEGLKARLEKSEEDLQAYARANGLLFLESERGAQENIVNQRLRQLQDELTRAQAARYEKESLYRLVESGEHAALPGVFDSKLMQDLTVRLAELKREHAQLAATFTSDYPRVKQVQSQVDEIEEVLARERSRAAEHIRNEYQAAVKREALLAQAFAAQQKQANQIAEKTVQYSILKREVETNKQLYEGLLQRMKEAGVSAGLKASNIRVVDPAEPPRRPARPRVLLNLALGVLLGLALGVGGAYLQNHLDNTLKTPEDVEHFLRMPALATVPSVESVVRGRVYGGPGRSSPTLGAGDSGKNTALAGRAGWHRIDAATPQHNVLSEAFRGLRTSVLLSTAERPPRTLLVTSAQPAEGKTTVSANLAISLAQLGQRVLLLDADLRRPSVHKAFSLGAAKGLVNVLTGHDSWRSVVQRTDFPALDALVCGPVPPNPVELLSSGRMRAVLREVLEDYEFVVVDSPPLLNVSDSRVIASLVEGVILVVKGGETPRELAQRAAAQIGDVAANVIGVVLNNVDIRRDGYGYYAYNHYYTYGEYE
jgi:capsular exopolysaccharide synthesis family protein